MAHISVPRIFHIHPQKKFLKVKFIRVIKSKFEFKHDRKCMEAFKRSFVRKKVKNQLMSAVPEEQNINLIFTEIGQGRGLLMSIISWQHKSGFHGRP